MQFSKLPYVKDISEYLKKTIYPKKNGKNTLRISTTHQPVTNLRKAAEDLQGNGNGAGSPSLPASTESRTPATSRSPRSPNDGKRRDSQSHDQELPGIKPVPGIRFAAGLFFF